MNEMRTWLDAHKNPAGRVQTRSLMAGCCGLPGYVQPSGAGLPVRAGLLSDLPPMTRHILVVDDNGDVRDVVVMMLIEGGFLATAAPGGVAMRDLMAADRIPFDAIVLDSLMPGEPSAALAMHAKDKKIPVVMISGSIERINFADEHGLQLLRKPFGVDDLLQAVEEAIASGQFGQRDA